MSRTYIEPIREELTSIQMFIMDPLEIKSLSGGEVLNNKTTNYRTMLPEDGGLFCETIFGPLKFYSCRCGHLRGIQNKKKTCSKCGVEVTNPRIRRYRIGHIQLASPIPHVWFLRVSPFYFQILSGLKTKDLEFLFTSRLPVVLNVYPSSGTIGYYSPSKRAKQFKGSACQAIYDYLKSIDVNSQYWSLCKIANRYALDRNKKINNLKVPITISLRNKKRQTSYINILKRLRIMYHFMKNGRKPASMMLTVVSVLPPELRPFIVLKDNLVVSSDLNMFYKRIIERNERLRIIHIRSKKEKDIVTDPISLNELTLLQHAVDSLIDNGRRGRVVLSKRKVPLKSLVDILKGKEGRFRMNLLGKRVDYSGRTVISVGPRLKLTQCGLPIEIALALYKIYICNRINSSSGKLQKIFKKFIDQVLIEKHKKIDKLNVDYRWIDYIRQSSIFGFIDDLIYEHPIILNRAPTLHRMNVQPFQPILINSKAIQLHPLVCSSFNADFDGDQMAIHYVLNLVSQVEVRILMMSYNNIVSPANGGIIIGPSQDIIFGLYYATLMVEPSKVFTYFNLDDIRKAVSEKVISIQDRIKYFTGQDYIQTTPGRLFLESLIPSRAKKHVKWNNILTKKAIQDIIFKVYLYEDTEDLLFFSDQLMAYGFSYAHIAGISLSIQDIIVPSLKEKIIKKEVTNPYGTMQSKWSKIQSHITTLILRDVNLSKRNLVPPIYMLVHSGARGTIVQMRQLAGIRGLMVKPSGDVIEMAIPSNFREGLGLLYYYYSTHGARKGVIDTSIRTATSGYLTRRLVYTAQDFIVTTEDCQSPYFLTIRTEYKDGRELRSLSQQVIGRTLFDNILDPVTGKTLFIKNSTIYPDKISKLKGIEEIRVRSPLTCQSTEGICQLCYGFNMASSELPNIGEAVGVIAAQSIGEPGTQLTMRTFHMGGVLLGGQSASSVKSTEQGRIYFKNGILFKIKNSFQNIMESTYLISMKAGMELIILNEEDHILTTYDVPMGSVLYCKENQYVQKGNLLFEYNPNFEPVFYKNVQPGYLSYKKPLYPDIPSIMRIKNQKALEPYYKIESHRKHIVSIPNNYLILPEDFISPVREFATRKIQFGDVLYYIPRSGKNSEDITGGLSKISQLFEFTSHTSKGFRLAPFTGFLSINPKLPESLYKKRSKLKRKKKYLFKNDFPLYDEFPSGIEWEMSSILQMDTSRVKNINIAKYKYYKVKPKIRHMTFVQKGDLIIHEASPWKESLFVLGANLTIKKFKHEIVSIFLENGVNIHDKHLELIFRRMFGYVNTFYNKKQPYILQDELQLMSYMKGNVFNLIEGSSLLLASASARGITKVVFDTNSFLAAASFQNTAQALNKSAIEGHKDNLKGLSINVMMGRISPMGSGII